MMANKILGPFAIYKSKSLIWIRLYPFPYGIEIRGKVSLPSIRIRRAND